jgi:ABC-type phosphate/phosphonate transport system substrate-binding protein
MKSTLSGVLLSLLAAGAVAAPADVQVLGVREGLSEQMSPVKMQDRYKEFAEYVAKVVGKPTVVDASQEAKTVFANMKAGKYAVMFVRPAGLAGRAIRESDFTLVASAQDELYGAIIVPKDSPLKRPEDLVGKRIAMPEKSAFITKVGLAALRDQNIDASKLNIQYTRYQDSAAYMVDQKMVDAALVSPILSKPWEQKGGRVLMRTQNVPSWAVVASSKLSAADVDKLRKALVALDTTPEGRKILKGIGVTGFSAGKQEDYVALLKWIGV